MSKCLLSGLYPFSKCVPFCNCGHIQLENLQQNLQGFSNAERFDMDIHTILSPIVSRWTKIVHLYLRPKFYPSCKIALGMVCEPSQKYRVCPGSIVTRYRLHCIGYNQCSWNIEDYTFVFFTVSAVLSYETVILLLLKTELQNFLPPYTMRALTLNPCS